MDQWPFACGPKLDVPWQELAMTLTPQEAISKQRLFNTSAGTTCSFEQFCHSSKSLAYSSYWGVFKSQMEKNQSESDCKLKDVKELKYRLLCFLKLTPILHSLNTVFKPVPTDMLKHNTNRRMITLHFLPKWCHLLVKVTWHERLAWCKPEFSRNRLSSTVSLFAVSQAWLPFSLTGYRWEGFSRDGGEGSVTLHFSCQAYCSHSPGSSWPTGPQS